MADVFKKYCTLVFKEIQKELSDNSFTELQRVIGMWPMPKDWRTPDAKSGYLMLPDRGLCIIETPFEGVGNFKISISMKMGEVRLGFLLPPEFSTLIDGCHPEITAFIEREYTSNLGRSRSTLTNFSTTPSGQTIIDFIFYDQFASMDAMEKAMQGLHGIPESLARSTALTLSHLYCNIVSCMITEKDASLEGIEGDEGSVSLERNETQRIYILIDPREMITENMIEEKVTELDGIYKSTHQMQVESRVIHLVWPTTDRAMVQSAEKELRQWSYSLGCEIHIYEHFENSIDHIELSDLPIVEEE